jgi:hypothetical protein
MRWILVIAAFALAPTIVHAWEHGSLAERHRFHAELRREWREAMRQTHCALAEARREIRQARAAQREAVREAAREARQAAQATRRYFRW